MSQNTAQNAFSSAKKEGLKTQKVLAPKLAEAGLSEGIYNHLLVLTGIHKPLFFMETEKNYRQIEITSGCLYIVTFKPITILGQFNCPSLL